MVKRAKRESDQSFILVPRLPDTFDAHVTFHR